MEPSINALTEPTLEERVDVLADIVRGISAQIGFIHSSLVVEKEEAFTLRFSGYLITPDGFVIDIFIKSRSADLKFSTFQIKANFPAGIDFIKATSGALTEQFGFGYQATDGHPKEGLVGGYTSSNRAVGVNPVIEDGVLLVSYQFKGPEVAASIITFDQVKLTLGGTVVPLNLPANIVAATE